MIKVPVRFTGNGVIKCSLERNNAKKKLLIYEQNIFIPDLVDGNLFSNYISIPLSSMETGKRYKVKEVSIVSQDLKEDLRVEVINSLLIFEGQLTQIILKLTYTDSSQAGHTNCKKSEYRLAVYIRFDGGTEESLLNLKMQCRSTKQSFIFTFLDHDGSVQQAAAVRPLIPCVQTLCPVMLTLHGTGIVCSLQL